MEVRLSNELVALLSDQLYASPLKAIEELVVNAYDADASECRVAVPDPARPGSEIVVVWDNGTGMDQAGLMDLWLIGRSNKINVEYARRLKRKQIGKFGIGKLATYAMARHVTYITRTGETLLGVTLDYDRFRNAKRGASSKPVVLELRQVIDWAAFLADPAVKTAYEAVGLTAKELTSSSKQSWTLVVLESLRDKAKVLSMPRLRWVLQTAMPLKSEFSLHLNGVQIESAKTDATVIAQFRPDQLPADRLRALNKATKQQWTADKKNKLLLCPLVPNGIGGSVIVTEKTLEGGKSDDLGRSNGFFIRVHDRLVGQDDPLFGLPIGTHAVFNRFRADLSIDDLNDAITASREGLREGKLKSLVRHALGELYGEARARYQIWEKESHEGAEDGARAKEGERNFVNAALVERAVADVLTVSGEIPPGGEADQSWFYLRVPAGTDVKALAKKLYDEPRDSYRYTYVHDSKVERMVRFDPSTATFQINEDHELVRAHVDDRRSRLLLEDLVTAEALLEVYLREAGTPPSLAGEVLEKRDRLLRSLAEDHVFSLKTIAQELRDSAANDVQLESALVAASRSLGFVATHVAGAGEPDGLARFSSQGSEEVLITLEAKASDGTPALTGIDVAGLESHKVAHNASGCLLIAPQYPGSSREDGSELSQRVNTAGVSCWTIDQLARVVEMSETRHLTAQHVLEIVLHHFTPSSVTAAVDALLAQPAWKRPELYLAVLEALRDAVKIRGKAPTTDMILMGVASLPGFRGEIDDKVIRDAVATLSKSSKGLMQLSSNNKIILFGSVDELAIRVAGLTDAATVPRRSGPFRATANEES